MRRRTLTARNRERGISLLEVMIAVAVISLATLSATLLLVPVARQSNLRREIELANTSAKRILERIQSTPFESILGTYPPSYGETITGLPGGALTVTYTDPATDPLLIQVALTWDNAQMGTLQRTFDTVRTR